MSHRHPHQKRPTKNPTEAPFQSANVDAPTGAPSLPTQTQRAVIVESESGGVDYGLIAAIVFGALFCCILCLFVLYYLRNKKKQEDEVNRLNIQVGQQMDVGMAIPDASPMSVADGNPTTFTGHMQQVR